ncbi:Kinesin-like protein kif3b, partial [Cladochytrium tenue]
MAESVAVCVRCRPLSAREKERGEGARKCVQIHPDRGVVVLQNPRSADGGGGGGGTDEAKSFTFDAAFDENCTQVEVYNATARGIVDAVLNGFNGTVFCYGQTGTGKTFSMQGISNVPHLRGIIPNAFNHIFDHIARSSHKQFLVRVSFLEIYNEDIRDLLLRSKASNGGKQQPTHLELKEHPETGVYVKDLSSFVVKSVAEMEQLMAVGNSARSVGATLMNETSSRSHSIFTIHIESAEASGSVDGKDRLVGGKLHLVDLAGSERQSKTGATGERLKEATKINLTLMIATLSPASYNYDETLSTLRYANRAKNIKNKPKVNEDPKDAMLREYQEEIHRLKQALEARQQQKSASGVRKVIKKVKKSRRADGGTSGGGNSGDGEDDSEADEGGAEPDDASLMDGETIARMQAQVEAERRALQESRSIAEEERRRVAAELERRAQELERERRAREELARQLQSMEGKLLKGGVNIVERVADQQRSLQEAQARLQAQKRVERELQQRLESRQEVQLQMEESYASLQDEVDVKSRKLKKLWAKVQGAKAEIGDLQDEFRNEREDLLDTIRELTRELGLKAAIIDNFVPPDEARKIERRAAYNDEANDWEVVNVTHFNLANRVPRPCALRRERRPISQYARRIIMGTDGPLRYFPENLLKLK